MSKARTSPNGWRRTPRRIEVKDPALDFTASLKFTLDEDTGQLGGVIDLSVKGHPAIVADVHADAERVQQALYGLRDALVQAMGGVSVRMPVESARLGRA